MRVSLGCVTCVVCRLTCVVLQMDMRCVTGGQALCYRWTCIVLQVDMRGVTGGHALCYRLALGDTCEELSKTCCRVWLCFVQHISAAALSSMMSSVVVTLLPYLNVHTQQVTDVFKYLIIDRRYACPAATGAR